MPNIQAPLLMGQPLACASDQHGVKDPRAL